MKRRHRQLLKYLTLREIKARYKQSFLGFLWVILNPFFQMLIMSFVFSKIIRFETVGTPYPVFIFTGLLPWIFFTNATTSAMEVFVSNASLIKKVYFPREILVISTLAAKAVDFLLALVILLLLMVFYKIQFSWYMLFFIPIFFVQFIFTYALSLLLGTFNLFYRDVKYLFELVLRLWFYVTPILYAVDFFPEQYRWIFQINPMSVFINAYRQVLIGQDLPNLVSLLIGIAMSFVALFVAQYIFKRLEGTFADVI